MVIKKSVIGFFIFLLLFPLDMLSYLVGNAFEINIPLGFLGISLSFAALFFWGLERGERLIYFIAYTLIFCPIFILVLISDRSGLEDYYFWLRTLAIFFSGFLFYKWLYEEHVKSIELILLFIFLCALMSSIFFEYQGLNYLRLSDGALMLVFLIISVSSSRAVTGIVVVLSFFMIYNLESRFSMLGFAICLSLYLLLSAKKVFAYIIIALTPMVIFFSYLVGYYFFLKLDNVHENRLLRLIYATDQDTSLAGRTEMLSSAFDVLVNNMLFGEYKYYLDYGPDGSYAHNLVSYWSEFGLAGVLYSVVLLFLCFASIKKAMIYLKASPVLAKFIILCSSLTILGLLFSKSYNWTIIYFATGLNLSFLAHVKALRINVKHHLPPPPSTQ